MYILAGYKSEQPEQLLGLLYIYMLFWWLLCLCHEYVSVFQQKFMTKKKLLCIY